jgi:hypothetical protein
MIKIRSLAIATIVLLVLLGFASTAAFAETSSSAVTLQMGPPSVFDRHLYFTVDHPQSAVQVNLVNETSVIGTMQVVPGTTESTFTVEADIKNHEYRAIAIGADGLELGQSGTIVFGGAQYLPAAPSWDLKSEETVITGRLNVSGKVDGNAASVFLAINGKLAYRTTPVNGTYSFKKVAMPKQYNWVQVIAKNEWGQATTKSTRVDYFNVMRKAKNYIVIDKSELCLFYMENNEISDIYPIAIGTPKTPTLEGSFVVADKLITNPNGDWGARRIVLFTKTAGSTYRYTGYNLHGTNQPGSIGKMASHGCVRMFNEDAIAIYNRVNKGFEVFIVP